jgi:hypothetical protein
MAALGDSVTLAYTTPDGEADSWSTGTSPAVRSHYFRIRAATREIRGRVFNFAEPGASFGAMQAQARKAIAKRAEYITVMGGEEYCGDDELTSLTQDFGHLIQVLARARPRPRVFVASVRNVGALVRTLQRNRAKVLKYFPKGFVTCSIGLDSPPARLVEATKSVVRVNAILARICGQYANCRFDGNAVFRMPIAYGDLATDYSHPSLAGQRRLAEVTWKATFPFGR